MRNITPDLSKDVTLQICTAAAQDDDLLDAHDEDRLLISAVCLFDRPFTLYHEEPEICKAGGELGRLAKMELFRANKCRIMLHDFSEHALYHLRSALRYLIYHSDGFVRDVEVRFLDSRIVQPNEDDFAIWYFTFRQFACHLSPNVTWSPYSNNSNDVDQAREHDVIRTLARKAIDAREKFGDLGKSIEVDGEREEHLERVVFSVYASVDFDRRSQRYSGMFAGHRNNPVEWRMWEQIDQAFDRLLENEEEDPEPTAMYCRRLRTSELHRDPVPEADPEDDESHA
ncbi:hypothetical protein BDZ85DRAFT_59723 [Elsinoe ampelina]|uniref:Uncharacterized protein n=1 Tax=Elsinoe ampelina TaxID=302913 RepID=A0A6A6G0H4_9PEZI|nr:hypothetical protein BDZ85DRAFT_59723 [Elsinoe ampelina]